MYETPLFKTPVVNIGIRQEGRDRAENVIDVDHDTNMIINAVKKAMKLDLTDISNPFGEGTTGKQISRILAEIKIDDKLLQKKNSY